MMKAKAKADTQRVRDLRVQLMAARAQIRLEQETIANQAKEINEIRTAAYETAQRFAKEGLQRAADREKERQAMLASHYETIKQMEMHRKESSDRKVRLDAMTNYVKLALKACQRGRRQKRKAKSLAQARVMLEASLDEDGALAWEQMPAAQKAVMVGMIGMVGMAAAYLFGKKAA